MQQRKRIEQELATLALAVGAKSNEEATAALWDLYTQFALLTAEERVRKEFSSQQASLEAKLQARLSALQSELAAENVAVPEATKDLPVAPTPTADTPTHAEEPAPTPVSTEMPIAPTQTTPVSQEPEAKESQAEENQAEEPALVVPADEEPVANTTASEKPIISFEPIAEEKAPLEEKQTPNVVERAQQGGEKKSLNDRFAQKALSFGLNDRIGFTKALFEGSGEDFNRVVSQLNTLGTLAEAEDFLDTHIAPEYGWDAQEEMAERFKAAVAQRFS